MSDLDDVALELSSATVDVLDELLRTSNAFQPPHSEPPTVSQQVRYLCEALSSSEAREIERGLTISTEARRSLRATRTALIRLQALSWSEARAAAAAGDPIAREWLALVS